MKDKIPNLPLPDKEDYKSLYYFTVAQLWSMDGILNTSSIVIEQLREALTNANETMAKIGTRIDSQHAQIMSAIQQIHAIYKPSDES